MSLRALTKLCQILPAPPAGVYVYDLLRYDREHGVEADPYAFVNDGVIELNLMTEARSSDEAAVLSPRAARCLAASLLRAADKAES